MSEKLSYEKVRDYINGEEGNGCKLLSTVYVNNRTKLLIQCSCGENFEASFNAFKSQNQKQCPKCGDKKNREKKRNNIEEVKNYIEGEEGNGCKLLSTEYKSNSTKLLIQCACGEIFKKTFNAFKSGQKQCKKCGIKKRAEKQRNQVVFNCDYCGKESSKTKSEFNRCKHHFCSKECNDKFQENQIVFNCDYCEKESNIKKSYFENYKHHFCSKECQYKWQSENLVGENSPHWNPNLTDEERERGKTLEDLSQWRKDIYKRDNYTCQCCGDNKGGNLNAHHINSYNWDKEHRTDINNGVTLCEKCHKEFHKIYGYGNNTITQFREFLFNKYTQSKDLKFLALIENIDLTTRAF